MMITFEFIYLVVIMSKPRTAQSGAHAVKVMKKDCNCRNGRSICFRRIRAS